MRLTHSGTVPVYTVSAGASSARQLPTWKSDSKKKNWDQSQPIELLQDFGFEGGHSVCVKVSEDGRWVMSTGAYKVGKPTPSL